jgi:hypothetical protein
VEGIRSLVGEHTRLLTCLAVWNGMDPGVIIPQAIKSGIGLYGFTKPQADSLLPPVSYYLSKPVDEFSGDSRSIAYFARIYNDLPIGYVNEADKNPDVWTATSYENIFRTAAKPTGASNVVGLVMAKNEYQSGQVLLRNNEAFTIENVTFSDLISGSNTINKSNIKFNYVEYEHLTGNSCGGGPWIPGQVIPGDFPDALSNEKTVEVAANSTQPIWVTVYVPKETKAATYAGTMTISTAGGEYKVEISVEVCNVTLPDPSKGEFSSMLWQNIGGSWGNRISIDNHKADFIEGIYGIKKYSPRWWELIDNIADVMKEHRTNVLYVNTIQLLVGGPGTSYNPDSKTYHFDWSRFDEYIEHFIDKGVIKQLEAIALCDRDHGLYMEVAADSTIWTGRAPYLREDVQCYFDQFLPALHKHLKEKHLPDGTATWLDIWMQNLSDEPKGAAEFAVYKNLAQKCREHCPGMRIGDPYETESALPSLMELDVDIHIPLIRLMDNNRDLMKELQAKGKEVYPYSCVGPAGKHLTNFTDKPVYQNRLIGTYCFSNGTSGFQHWGWNAWGVVVLDPKDLEKEQVQRLVTINEMGPKGDNYMVFPDVKNNTIKSSIRYEAFRDAAQDFELFKILEDKNPESAKKLATSIVQSSSSFTTDVNLMKRTRDQLVRAAADQAPEMKF